MKCTLKKVTMIYVNFMTKCWQVKFKHLSDSFRQMKVSYTETASLSLLAYLYILVHVKVSQSISISMKKIKNNQWYVIYILMKFMNYTVIKIVMKLGYLAIKRHKSFLISGITIFHYKI